MHRRLIAIATIPALLAAAPARADEGEAEVGELTLPPHQGSEVLVTFEVAGGDDHGKWTLRRGFDVVVCTMPCTAALDPSVHYFAYRDPPYTWRPSLQGMSVEIRPGMRGVVRVTPRKGASDAAIATGVLSLGAIAAGVLLIAIPSRDPSCTSACQGGPLGDTAFRAVSASLIGVGIVGAVASILWADASHREHLELAPGTTTPQASASGPTLKWAGGGVVGTF